MDGHASTGLDYGWMRQGGLPWDGDRLPCREPSIETLQIFQDASRHGRYGTPSLIGVDDVDRLFHELAELGVTVPQSVSPGLSPSTAAANCGDQCHAILASTQPSLVVAAECPR